MTAQYLIRFDDICPGMNWPVWREIEKILIAANVKPLLAVVPSNQDDKLNFGPPEARFWEIVRGWQDRGWTIGLHGYQHRYVTRDAGLVGLNDRSEFSGVPAGEQAEKLKRAVEIFQERAVRPEVWIAPAHSFDAATVAVLKELGIGAISDGFFLSPHRDAQEMLWIPQQIWGFRYRPFGLWTVCYHHNSWKEDDLQQLERDVRAYRSRMTTFNEVISAPKIRRKAWHDDWVSNLLLSTLLSKRWVKNRIRRNPRRTPP